MSGDAYQLWVSGFAAFYAYDNLLSALLASRRNPEKIVGFATRAIVGGSLSAFFLMAGLGQ